MQIVLLWLELRTYCNNVVKQLWVRFMVATTFYSWRRVDLWGTSSEHYKTQPMQKNPIKSLVQSSVPIMREKKLIDGNEKDQPSCLKNWKFCDSRTNRAIHLRYSSSCIVQLWCSNFTIDQQPTIPVVQILCSLVTNVNYYIKKQRRCFHIYDIYVEAVLIRIF